ncbi:MAG: hypothetical protein U0412_10115 [Nitrospira sp.]
MHPTKRSAQLLQSGILLAFVLWATHGVAIDLPQGRPPVFNEKELAAYRQKGRGSLTGQAFLTSPAGKAITQAGEPVHLIPATRSTRAWFEHAVRIPVCPATDPTPTKQDAAACAAEAVRELLADKKLLPFVRTTRANPTGHFWFTKIPAGQYYVLSVINGGSGSHQDERISGVAWLLIDLETGEKATNLVVTDCKSGLC